RAKYWAAMGTMSTLLTVAPIDGKAAMPVSGRICGSIWEIIYPAVQASQTQRFDIPPGPLGTVLDAFQKLTGVEVQIPDEKMRGFPLPGVSGIYSTEQALQQLLTGTGLDYRFSGPNTVTLELKAVTASIEVSDRVSPASLKYTEPLRDIPQTI